MLSSTVATATQERDRALAAKGRLTGLDNLTRISERMLQEAEQAGRPISVATVRPRAKAWMHQWEKDVATVMKRFTDSQRGSNDGW